MKDMHYPLIFHPVYQDYIWGGRKLADVFDREIPSEPTAESWEISDRPDGMSIVNYGELEGSSLRSLMESRREELLGPDAPETFPLLVKILDAKGTLSVQVHPNDETAATFGGEAKSEMWYVLDAEPGAKVYCGLKPGMTPETLKQAIQAEQLEGCLETIEVVKGDVIFVPGGCVHAIAEGCLLLEVQQNSNTTYRLYDWGRMGHDGKPRDLHIDQAIEVIDWESKACGKIPPHEIEPGRTHLLRTPYFELERIVVEQTMELETPGRWQMLFVESGGAKICDIYVPAGTTCLIPACMDTIKLECRSTPAPNIIRIM